MKKGIFAVVIVALLAIAGVGVAQSNWLGTSWISSGSTVSSQNLKSNLDYLYNVKAPKPQDCNGTENFLGWSNGGWTCAQQTAPANCTFNGNSVSNGDAVTAFSASTVAFGETCQSQTRTCSNGVLSGSYQAAGCSVAGATACIFNGATVAHQETVQGYQSSRVAFGETCQSQTRTCNNGTLSGSYQAASCSVAPAATCVFDGITLSNGDTVRAYENETVPFGQTCQQQVRTCSDGTLSGSYGETTCQVSREDPIRFYQRDFIVESTNLVCRNIANGTTMNRDSNNECPGFRWFESTDKNYTFESNPGIKYYSQTASDGPGHSGLASDSTTLIALCKLKGYQYVVGQAPRNSNGFREFTSPGNNKLVYGTGSYFRISNVTKNQTFNGQKGYVICSDTPGSSTGGGEVSPGGGGGNNNISPNVNIK